MPDFTPLRALAPAKINLGLFVGPRRGDGRHLIASVMQSISLGDELVIEPARGVEGDELVCPGVEGPTQDNLAMRALAAFREATSWRETPVRLTVRKRVPIAAGLGGGSADAAAALRLAAAASGHYEEDLLQELGGRLGADVPAQVRPGRWLAQGAGESLRALREPAPPLGVLVLTASEPLSTAAVYAELDRSGSARSAEEIALRAAELADALGAGEPLPPAALLANDLECPALSLCPAIAPLLDRVRGARADHMMVSGSGPTVLGLYAAGDGPARADSAARALRAEGIVAFAARTVGAAHGEPSPLTADGVASSVTQQ
jgi:4-diphosphocytidyl-2-C-methyl-D-erythritol kinase